MHSCQRIYKLHSPLHSLSNTHTHTRWPLTYTCDTTTQTIQNSHSSSPKKNPTQTYMHTHTRVHAGNTAAHTHTEWNLRTQKCVPTYIIWKLTSGADNKQLSPEHREEGTKKKKKDRRLRKQIGVMSSELNGKPCVRKTGESIHIYCCQDFNINIIESTSDVSLSADWLTKTSTSCRLYLRKIKIWKMGGKKEKKKRLIHRQTPLNKQIIMLGY